MGYKEKQIINDVLLEGSKHGRLFRANSGMAWAGKIIKKIKGFITLKNPRPFHGMPAGTPDIIGWESKTLCEILGEDYRDNHPCKYYEDKAEDKTQCVLCGYDKKIAIFKAVEIKTGDLQLTEDQKRFKKILLEQGGIFQEVREKQE